VTNALLGMTEVDTKLAVLGMLGSFMEGQMPTPLQGWNALWVSETPKLLFESQQAPLWAVEST